MRRTAKQVLAVVVMAAGMALWAQSSPGDIEELKAELKAAQDLLRSQQAMVEALQKRVGELEARQAAQQAAPTSREAKAGKDAAAPATVTWKNGGTTFAFPQAQLKLVNRLQYRWTQDNYSDPEDTDNGAFRIRRFKTQLTGWAYTPDLTFRLQVDWANANTSLGILDDAYVDYDVTRGKGYFHVRGGQFKTPFGRQSLASTATDMFADRSFVTTTFANIRDVGMMVWGQFGPSQVKDLIEYQAGVFNGGGRSEYTNTDARYQTDFRVMISPWGSAGYDEANPFGTKDPKVSFGLAYEHGDRREDKSGWMAGREYHTWGYDLMVKYRRVTAYGEWFDRKMWDVHDKTSRSDGYNAQVGYLLVPGRWEVFAGRWGYDPDRSILKDRTTEWGLGTNVYFSGFNSKLQADWRKTSADKTGKDSYEFRVQYQIMF